MDYHYIFVTQERFFCPYRSAAYLRSEMEADKENHALYSQRLLHQGILLFFSIYPMVLKSSTEAVLILLIGFLNVKNMLN